MGANKHRRVWSVKDPKFIQRAEEVRSLKLDPGDAYLTAVADYEQYLKTSEIKRQLIDSFDKPDYIKTY